MYMAVDLIHYTKCNLLSDLSDTDPVTIPCCNVCTFYIDVTT